MFNNCNVSPIIENLMDKIYLLEEKGTNISLHVCLVSFKIGKDDDDDEPVVGGIKDLLVNLKQDRQSIQINKLTA